MVYFIRARGTRFVKIGYAKDGPGAPASRLRALQYSSPFRLVLEGAIAGEPSDEAAVHQQFAAYRTSGEWFRLPSREVRAFCATHTPPDYAAAHVGRPLVSERTLPSSRALSSEAQKILVEISEEMSLAPSATLEYLIRHKGAPRTLSGESVRLVGALAKKCAVEPHAVVELAIRTVACWEGIL